MKTAREVAHAIVCERQDSEWCHWSSNKDSHAHYCDSLTAAIEARDAEVRDNVSEAAMGAWAAAVIAERDAALTERDRLREACQRIAEYETDWTQGPAANVAALQTIAKRALAASPATPTPGPPRHECPSCDFDDSVPTPEGKLLSSKPIPPHLIGAARPPDAVPGTPDETWAEHSKYCKNLHHGGHCRKPPPQPVCLRCGGSREITTYGPVGGWQPDDPEPEGVTQSCPSCQPNPKETP